MVRGVLEQFLQTRGALDRRILRLSQHRGLDCAAIAVRLGGTPTAVHHRERRLRRELNVWLQSEIPYPTRPI